MPKELVYDQERELVLEAGECPYCKGLFGVDLTYIEQVSNVFLCPMCEMGIRADNDEWLKTTEKPCS